MVLVGWTSGASGVGLGFGGGFCKLLCCSLLVAGRLLIWVWCFVVICWLLVVSCVLEALI